MGSLEKTLVVLGSNGVGRATITGCMLFKYGGIEMSVMQTLEGLGDRDKNRIYGEAIDNLKGLKLPMRFYTPKGYHVFVIDPSAVQADCTILVIPADLASHDVPPDGVGAANKLIVIINKMDLINWSEERFQEIVDKLGYSREKVPIIPISARDGDNVVEKSPNSPWYKGWNKEGHSGTTLLKALDVSLQT